MVDVGNYTKHGSYGVGKKTSGWLSPTASSVGHWFGRHSSIQRTSCLWRWLASLQITKIALLLCWDAAVKLNSWNMKLDILVGMLYSKNKQKSRNQNNAVLTYVVSSCFFLPSMLFILLCCFALLASINHCKLLIRCNYDLFIYLSYIIKMPTNEAPLYLSF